MAPKKGDFDKARYNTLLALTSESGHTLGTWFVHLFNHTRFVFAELREKYPEAYASISEYEVPIEQLLNKVKEMLIAICNIASNRAQTKEKINISRLVLQSPHFALSVGLRQIKVRKELDFTFPEIEGVWGMLMLVMTNLIHNAVEAMANNELVDGKRGELLLKTQLAEDRNYAEVIVSDTGTGIPSKIRKKIFDLFFSTKGSSGIGLASAKQIVKLHKGTISCRSEVGKGTTFTIRLPIAKL